MYCKLFSTVGSCLSVFVLVGDDLSVHVMLTLFFLGKICLEEGLRFGKTLWQKEIVFMHEFKQ